MNLFRYPVKGKLQAFTLVELLVVMGVISILLAMTLPNMISVAPVRKTALYEVKEFLEYARSEAVTRGREVYVAFANENIPGEEAPFRAYAAFVAAGDAKDGLIVDQEINQISNWKMLPRVLSELIRRHDAMPEVYNDAAAEETFARVFNTTSFSSRHFRIFTYGEVLSKSGEIVLSRSRKIYEVFMEPEHDDNGNVTHLTTRILSIRDL